MKIAMLGSGFIGRFYADSIQGYRNKDKIVSIYSRKEESAKKFAADYLLSIANSSLHATKSI
jgi:predicted dehydrogenase